MNKERWYKAAIVIYTELAEKLGRFPSDQEIIDYCNEEKLLEEVSAEVEAELELEKDRRLHPHKKN